ncbi:GroES-like protein [Panus rudis PR-1116 ss-1]|nr:GroES-like protein [Panus rudis PR-1116 ss-1]
MSIPKEQKAIIAPAQYSDPVIQTIDVRAPGANEVLIRVEAASLSPADVRIKDFGPPYVQYPALLGTESAGVVIPVSSQYGGFQKYAIAPAGMVLKVPDSINFDQASTILGGLATALVGFFGDYTPDSPYGRSGAGLTHFWTNEGKNKYDNQPVLILGGASSVGQYAIQIARLAGFSPIITTASLHNAPLLKSLGSTHVIDRTLPHDQIISEIGKIVPESLQVIYDAVSVTETQNVGYELLAPGGTLILVLRPVLDSEKAKTENKKVVFTYGWLHMPPCGQWGMDLLHEKIPEWLKNGDIKPNNVEVIPGGLNGVLVGLERLKNNQVSGKKLVVRPQET